MADNDDDLSPPDDDSIGKDSIGKEHETLNLTTRKKEGAVEKTKIFIIGVVVVALILAVFYVAYTVSAHNNSLSQTQKNTEAAKKLTQEFVNQQKRSSAAQGANVAIILYLFKAEAASCANTASIAAKLGLPVQICPVVPKISGVNAPGKIPGT